VSRLEVLAATVAVTLIVLALPFAGGAGPSPFSGPPETTVAATIVRPAGVVSANERIVTASMLRVNQETAVPAVATATAASVDTEHLAQKPVPPPPPVSKADAASGTAARRAAGGCPGAIGGETAGAPSAVSPGGVQGTTSEDLASFAAQYNSVRVANCLKPVPFANIRYGACLEQRLFWMAQDPSTDPANTWGHAGVRSLAPDANGVYYSDAVPPYGCDANLAGGSSNSGATVANKWWGSTAHRNALYVPSFRGNIASICVYFAMTHGDSGLTAEPYSFTRASARWGGC
jgi:hypothetical protein